MYENLETVLNMLEPEIRETIVKLMRSDPVLCTSFHASEARNDDPVTLLARAIINMYEVKQGLLEQFSEHLHRCPGQPKLLHF